MYLDKVWTTPDNAANPVLRSGPTRAIDERMALGGPEPPATPLRGSSPRRRHLSFPTATRWPPTKAP